MFDADKQRSGLDELGEGLIKRITELFNWVNDDDEVVNALHNLEGAGQSPGEHDVPLRNVAHGLEGLLSEIESGRYKWVEVGAAIEASSHTDRSDVFITVAVRYKCASVFDSIGKDGHDHANGRLRVEELDASVVMVAIAVREVLDLLVNASPNIGNVLLNVVEPLPKCRDSVYRYEQAVDSIEEVVDSIEEFVDSIEEPVDSRAEVGSLVVVVRHSLGSGISLSFRLLGLLDEAPQLERSCVGLARCERGFRVTGWRDP